MLFCKLFRLKFAKIFLMIITFAVFTNIVIWIPFWGYFLYFYMSSDQIYMMRSVDADIKRYNLKIEKKVQFVPIFCVPDAIGYSHFCDDDEQYKKILNSENAHYVITSSSTKNHI